MGLNRIINEQFLNVFIKESDSDDIILFDYNEYDEDYEGSSVDEYNELMRFIKSVEFEHEYFLVHGGMPGIFSHKHVNIQFPDMVRKFVDWFEKELQSSGIYRVRLYKTSDGSLKLVINDQFRYAKYITALSRDHGDDILNDYMNGDETNEYFADIFREFKGEKAEEKFWERFESDKSNFEPINETP